MAETASLPADIVSVVTAGVAARSPFDPAAHLPLLVDGLQVGWLPRRHAAILAAFDGVLGRQDGQGGQDGHGGVTLLPGCATAAARNVALAALARQLADAGHVRGWRDELFAVTPALEAEPFALIERAAARFLGLLTFASHMNGIVAGQRALWISRRSPHKAIDPDMWDNLVAGGMPAGSDPLETLVRECDEESGIPPDLARRVEAHGVIDVLREISEGVQWERVYVYDLVLPADFVPHNRDGEVAEHRRIDPEALLAIMADRAMTVDATLVTLDALRRRSWVAVQP
jgi:8-oxo-dGTP pyrophosphatase MutT (NUDIX family)